MSTNEHKDVQTEITIQRSNEARLKPQFQTRRAVILIEALGLHIGDYTTSEDIRFLDCLSGRSPAKTTRDQALHLALGDREAELFLYEGSRHPLLFREIHDVIDVVLAIHQ